MRTAVGKRLLCLSTRGVEQLLLSTTIRQDATYRSPVWGVGLLNTHAHSNMGLMTRFCVPCSSKPELSLLRSALCFGWEQTGEGNDRANSSSGRLRKKDSVKTEGGEQLMFQALGGWGRLQQTFAKAPDLAVLCSRAQGSAIASGHLWSWTWEWGRSGSNTFSEPVDQRTKKKVNFTVKSRKRLLLSLDLFSV